MCLAANAFRLLVRERKHCTAMFATYGAASASEPFSIVK